MVFFFLFLSVFCMGPFIYYLLDGICAIASEKTKLGKVLAIIQTIAVAIFILSAIVYACSD